MSPAFNLHAEASVFAARLSRLLNTTVCDGITLTAAMSRPDRVVVGFGITKQLLDVRRAIPLTFGGRKPSAFLGLFYRLHANAIERHLAVETSIFGLYADERLERGILRYDFERNKEGYPEAHLQIEAVPEAWGLIAAKPFPKVHLPLGGRRNRPILEDVIEMCVVEGVARGRPGWEEAVADGRERFRVGQLKAAVRRDPDSAREVLAELGRC